MQENHLMIIITQTSTRYTIILSIHSMELHCAPSSEYKPVTNPQKIEPVVCELFEALYLAGIAYSGGLYFAFFDQMIYRT